jgi:hypothetical protein
MAVTLLFLRHGEGSEEIVALLAGVPGTAVSLGCLEHT